MKNSSYANRGSAFEDFIRIANGQYARKQIAIIEKLPTEFIPLRDRSGKICSAKVEHKSKVDFIGRYRQYPIAIEAKNTNDNSIRFDRVEPHQAAYMDAFTAQPGTIGLVLVSFNLQHFFAIPWAFWGAAYDLRVRRGDKSSFAAVKFHDEDWVIPQKFSVRIEEMNPTWAISGHDRTFGLNYLENAEKYIF